MSDRWRDRVPGAEETAEDRAAELLRSVEDPVALSPSALARIRTRVLRGKESAWSPSLRAAFGLASLVAVLGAAAVIARLAGDGGVRLSEVAAGRCEVKRLAGDGALRLALVGPASLSMAATGAAPIVLNRGRLEIDSGDGEVTVEGGRARVIVGKQARVEIEILDGGKVRIAAFQGDTRVVWREQGVDIAVGTVWTPDGISPIADESEAAAGHALDGEVVSCEGSGAPNGRRDPLPVKPRKLEEPEAPRPTSDENAGRPRRVAVVAPRAGEGSPSVKVPDRAADLPLAVDDPAGDRPATPPPAARSTLAEESQMIADATQRLNHGGDAAGALATLDAYRSRFPDGKLAAAALVQRVKALRALSRGAEALALLDGSADLEDKLRLLRGELRAEAGRCGKALSDFDATLASPTRGQLEERALYGRASCRSQRGQSEGARGDLQRLIERFPSGKLAAEARRALAE